MPNYRVSFMQWFIVKARNATDGTMKAQRVLEKQVAENGVSDLLFDVEVDETTEPPTQ